MTREEIEAEGWKFIAKGIDMWFQYATSPVDTTMQDFYGYKPFNLYLNYGPHDQKMIIKCDFTGGKDFYNSDVLFEGHCPTLEDLRYISKLLHIKDGEVLQRRQ